MAQKEWPLSIMQGPCNRRSSFLLSLAGPAGSRSFGQDARLTAEDANCADSDGCVDWHGNLNVVTACDIVDVDGDEVVEISDAGSDAIHLCIRHLKRSPGLRRLRPFCKCACPCGCKQREERNGGKLLLHLSFHKKQPGNL